MSITRETGKERIMASHLCVEELTPEEAKMYRSLARQFTEGLIFPVRQQVDDDKDHDKIVDPIMKQILRDFGLANIMLDG